MWSVVRSTAARQLRVGRLVKQQTSSQGFLLPSAYRLAVLKRSFTETASEQATKSAATDTTPKAPKAAFTATTKKPAAKKSKAATTKSVAAKAKKPTKKKKAVKAAPKKKVVKKVLSPEEKQRIEVRELRKIALLDPPKQLPINPWLVFTSQYYKDHNVNGRGGATGVVTEIAEAYKDLSASEMERLSTIGAQNQVANAAAYQAWIHSKTPIEIDAANRARRRLKHLLASTAKSPYQLSRKFPALKDDRQPVRPRSGYALFAADRWHSGHFEGVSVPDAAARVATEWKTFTDAERKVYEDRALSEREKYIDDTRRILDRDTFIRSVSPEA